MIDRYTKLARVISTVNATAKTVVHINDSHRGVNVGLLSKLFADSGRWFLSNVSVAVYSAFCVNNIPGTEYPLQTSCQANRLNFSLIHGCDTIRMNTREDDTRPYYH